MPGLNAGPLRPDSQLVTIFGGSGFLGRHVVRALARRGYRIRVAVRRPDLAQFLQPLGRVGQIVAVQANLRYPASVTRSLANADIAVNLVGILQETGRQTFHGLQAEGAGLIAKAAAEAGLPLVHVSALGADAGSASLYARSKAAGEAAVLAARPDAAIFRPSVVFGPGDSFLTRFAQLARAFPVLPIAGGETRFQPVFVGDLAEAIALAVEGRVPGGRIYECGGPEIHTLREIVAYVLKVTQRSRVVVDLPWPAAMMQARAMELAEVATLGLLPDALKLSRDQITLLKTDNVVSPEAKGERRTLEGLGLTTTSLEAVAPGYLWRFRKTGQFAAGRGNPGEEGQPHSIARDPDGGNSTSDLATAPGPATVPDAARGH